LNPTSDEAFSKQCFQFRYAPLRIGTQKWVHVGCVRQWQKVSLSSNGATEGRCRVGPGSNCLKCPSTHFKPLFLHPLHPVGAVRVESTSTHVQSARIQRLKPKYVETAYNFCFHFRLAPPLPVSVFSNFCSALVRGLPPQVPPAPPAPQGQPGAVVRAVGERPPQRVQARVVAALPQLHRRSRVMKHKQSSDIEYPAPPPLRVCSLYERGFDLSP
jgi:hypothetical protein